MNLWEKYGLDPNTGNPPMAMDYRHVEMLHAEILRVRPRIAVEIGSHKGHSLVAFLEAMNELPELVVHVYELHLLPELFRAIEKSGHCRRVFTHTEPVWGSAIEPDFVFIDGDHGIPALADLAWCLAKNTRTIVMHDTQTWERLPECRGAWFVADLLRKMPSRRWQEDCEDREGENTWRGFGVSTLIS